MKATGIIRRVDELGRIVIPKEIRKNLHIKDGENMEIFIDSEEIILKKHAPMANINIAIENIVNCLYFIAKCSIFICDNEKILFSSQDIKDYQNKKISNELNSIISQRKNFITNDKIEVMDNFYSKFSSVIYPIIIDSDIIGAICIFGRDSANYIKEITTMAKFLEVSMSI